MISRRNVASAIGLVFAVATWPALADDADAIAEVAKCAEQLRLLMITPERSALEAIFSPDLSFGHSDGRVQTRAEYVDGLLNGKSIFNSIAIANQTVTVLGDIAIVRHRFDADAISNGKPATPHMAVLQVWRKSDGVWRLLVRQAHN